MNKYIENFITNEANNLPLENREYINFIAFYEDILNDDLSHLFAYLHYKLNNSFDYINYKMRSNYHYNAAESRELISLIDLEESLFIELKNTQHSFYINEQYLDVIKICKTFLSSSGGSKIPEDIKKINLIKSKPIFFMNSTITISHDQTNLKFIGEGSYAQVHKYKDPFYNKNFAKKKAKADLTQKELERFKIEYQSIKKLNSPYILEVYSFDEKENAYIMEYAEFTLYKYIQENNTKLSDKQRINIINQLFKAFEYIHSAIGLHRDISTTNVLLKLYDNDLIVVKIADFGLVKLNESNLTSDNTEFKGSLNDPKLDVVGGFKNYTYHHETYALCRLIYFVMTGRTVIDNRFTNSDFKNFVAKGISDNIEFRYKNIQQMKENFMKIDFQKSEPVIWKVN